MSKKLATVLVPLLLGAALLSRPHYSWAFDLAKLLDNVKSDEVKSIDVAGLAALRAEKNLRVFVYDVDPASSREEMGAMPRARALSSGNKFDAAAELPKDKSAKLVFSCHN